MKPWTITWGTRSWTDDDLLACDLVDIEYLVGKGWLSLDPWSGPLHLMCTIAALEARTANRPIGEVMAEIKASPAIEIVEALSARQLQALAG